MNRQYSSRHSRRGQNDSRRRQRNRPRKEEAYYARNRSPMQQIKARSVHRHATKRFSQYDTSAIRSKKSAVPRVIAVVVVIAAVAALAWWMATSVFADDKSDVTAGLAVEVTIPEGSSTSTIADLLYDSDVIMNRNDFLSEVSAQGASSSLKPGTYELATLMDYGELVDLLIAGPDYYGTKLTIPEGLTLADTAEIVEETLGITTVEFLDFAQSADSYAEDYPFLEGASANSLEGYLFPKTYDVPDGASADDVIRMMLDQFDAEMSDAGISYDGANGMTFQEIVTIASMIENETSVTSEMATVASVIYNRLEVSMRLQIDATVVYAMGESYTGGAVTYEDLEIDSPYNTYQNDGLPPGPICSPGVDPIKAAVSPEETGYLYYVALNDDGTHEFFEDYDSFLEAQQ